MGRRGLFLLAVSLMLFCGCAKLEPIIKVGESQDQMQRVLDNETKAYNAVKKALEQGRIKKGQPAESISRKYGEPVLVMPQEDGSQVWVYKPGYASFFENIKVYLVFKDGVLVSAGDRLE